MTAARLREAIIDAGVDQSELARRIGVTPGTINQIATGATQRSRYLPDIARELGVSLEWLKGETDERQTVPSMGKVVVLDSETREILRLLEKMSPADKRAIVQVARSMAKIPAKSDKLHDSQRGYRQKGER